MDCAARDRPATPAAGISVVVAGRRRTATAVDQQHRSHDGQCETHFAAAQHRSEEHTSELQSLMRISYAVFCLTKKNKHNTKHQIKRRVTTHQMNQHANK